MSWRKVAKTKETLGDGGGDGDMVMTTEEVETAAQAMTMTSLTGRLEAGRRRSREGGDPPGDGGDGEDANLDRPKISRREADTVTVPHPNVLAASADPR